MAMHTLYRWFGNIKYRGKTRAKNDFQIFILSECHSLEELPDILKKYFGNINYKKGIKDFSFGDYYLDDIIFMEALQRKI